jgi:hypothetical protein
VLPTPDPANGPRRGDRLTTPRSPFGTAEHPSRVTGGLDYTARRGLRRRLRLVRRHLGPGPYLDFGCGRGDLLALLAAHGSASGFEADADLAELARRAAPGCPVHTKPDAIPTGVFRGVLAPSRPDDATLALWRGALARTGGRVLLIGDGDTAPERLAAAGFAVRWEGREHWRTGPAVVVIEARGLSGA